MITVYAARGCWSCEESYKLLRRAGLKYTLVRVLPRSDLAGELLSRFPGSIDPTSAEGVRLPLFVDDETGLIGDMLDMSERIVKLSGAG